MYVDEIRALTQQTHAGRTEATTPSSSCFSETLSKSCSTDSLDILFEKAAATYKVDVRLLKAIAKQESNFQTDVVSGAGATGVMQLMPSTAKALGVTDALDPEQNIMGGAKLISQLLKKYDNNTELALAAYNAGTGNVAKYGGIPPFTETQNYVKKVMGYYQADSLAIPAAQNAVTNRTDAQQARTSAKAQRTQMTTKTTVSSFTYDDYLRFLDLYMALLQHGDGI